jgi:hypothetical protein
LDFLTLRKVVVVCLLPVVVLSLVWCIFSKQRNCCRLKTPQNNNNNKIVRFSVLTTSIIEINGGGGVFFLFGELDVWVLEC